MFSASLVSAMFHIARPGEAADEVIIHRNLTRAAQFVRGAHFNDYPQVPIIARSRKRDRLKSLFREVAIAEDDGDANAIIFGRVSLHELVSYFQEYHELPAEEEYIDLGVAWTAHANGSASYVSQCLQLLAAHPLQSPKIAVAIVDEGRPVPGASAEDFGGRLHQVQPGNLVMSAHATKVLWALIERLEQHGILDQTELYCALVPPASSSLGHDVFTHGNSPEILSALQALHRSINPLSIPVIINLSMGTHVGPHNGDSPLEDFVKTLPSARKRRYLFAAAGNDGLSGLSSSSSLVGGRPEFLRVQSDTYRSDELLIEFWWRQSDGGNLVIDVDGQDENGTPLFLAGALRIDSATATGVQLTQRSVPSSYYPTFSSLFHANCLNDMSCIAFAMSSPHSNSGRSNIDFTLTSQGDAVVNAWIAVAPDRKVHFVGSGEATSLRVPSILDEVICVAGIDANKNPWHRSSRGPKANYGNSQNTAHVSPRLAHLVELRNEYGTSFACPRACADAANVLANLGTGNPLSPQDLVNKVLGASANPNGWDARTGFGGLI